MVPVGRRSGSLGGEPVADGASGPGSPGPAIPYLKGKPAVTLSPIDAAIVVVYFAVVLVMGVYLERRAARSLESYFLGNGKMPWWLLGMSGSSTYFDIAGTMWMVSTFYVLGMRGLWVHWLWCFPFAGFCLAYKAKWAYRSGVLTGLEWLIFRFGSGRDGQAARGVTLLIAVVGAVLMLGYAGAGVGLFLEEFLPINKNLAVAILFSFTGLYVVLGGFYSVAYSDFFQTILLSFACVYIAVVAFVQLDPGAFRAAVGADWFSLKPVMTLPQPSAEYSDLFGLLILLWVAKGILGLFGGAADVQFQRFRAARNEGEASKIGLSWGLVMGVRWSMVIAFTAFGLSILAQNGEVVDSERVLPMVLNRVLPIGIKGLVLAGLFAALMSTLDSTLNVTASYVVNDLVKPIWKSARPADLVRVGYAATGVIVAAGIVISNYTERIADIWNPINFAFGASLLAPALLAPYWWRISGAAYCASGAVTLPVAFFIYFGTDLRELQYFPLLAGVSLLSCILGAFVLPPAPKAALMNYYRTVRPFGFWGPVRAWLQEAGEDDGRFERDRHDLPVAVVATLFFVLFYVAMMDVVLHHWTRLAWCSAGLLICGTYLYVFWWRLLERPE